MNIDKKIPLDIIAKGIGKDLNELLTEIEGIVSSGTKINIDYFINDRLDEESVEEIYDYFMETETDCLEDAFKEFGGDFSEEDIRMVRLKFVSEMGN